MLLLNIVLLTRMATTVCQAIRHVLLAASRCGAMVQDGKSQE